MSDTRLSDNGIDTIEARSNSQSIPNPASSTPKLSNIDDSFNPSVDFSNALVSDLFLNFAAIDGTDFRKIYPYSFTIYDSTPGKTSVIKEIFLPLPPNSFAMDIPPATQLTVTLNGIVEESNGAPLRNINISGTTGIVNKNTKIYSNSNASPSGSTPSVLNTIGDYAIRYGGLSNTVGAIQGVSRNVQTAYSRIKKSLGVDNSGFYPLNFTDDQVSDITGYYWFHSLLRFFEYYLHVKKSSDGKNIRLCFNVYKDSQYFYVSLNNFRWQKIPGSIEYNYSISLTAWKKNIDPTTNTSDIESSTIASIPSSNKFNLFDTVKNILVGARQTILSLQNVVTSANQDIYENILAPLNQAILLAKDSVGATKTLLDFLHQFSNGNFSSSITRAIQYNWSTYEPAVTQALKTNYSFNNSQNSISPIVSNDLQSTGSNQSQKNILPSDLEKNPYKYWQLFDSIDTDSLQLDAKSSDSINAATQKAASTTYYDLIKTKTNLEKFSKTISDKFSKTNKINLKNVQFASAINDFIISLDSLISFYKNQTLNPTNDYYSYYVDYAVSNGLDITKARSKFFVPFPVNATLESLALQYLGDAGRWVEISALNGLKEPYIDETGFKVSLISNGNGSTILVASRENLYVGQVVTISSDTVVPQKIKISEITEFGKNQFLISFVGSLDLSVYKYTENANILAYLPNTVNSNMLIAIPSNLQPLNNDQVNVGPGLDQLNSIAQLSKIDFLLTNNGDFAMLPNGNILTASGLTNLSQAVKIKLFTNVGSMIHRPNFGNSLQPGLSIANFSAKKYLKQINKLFAQDQRFTGILVSNIKVNGPAVDLNLLIGTQNTNVNLPVTTTIPINN